MNFIDNEEEDEEEEEEEEEDEYQPFEVNFTCFLFSISVSIKMIRLCWMETI